MGGDPGRSGAAAPTRFLFLPRCGATRCPARVKQHGSECSIPPSVRVGPWLPWRRSLLASLSESERPGYWFPKMSHQASLEMFLPGRDKQILERAGQRPGPGFNVMLLIHYIDSECVYIWGESPGVLWSLPSLFRRSKSPTETWFSFQLLDRGSSGSLLQDIWICSI